MVPINGIIIIKYFIVNYIFMNIKYNFFSFKKSLMRLYFFLDKLLVPIDKAIENASIDSAIPIKKILNIGPPS